MFSWPKRLKPAARKELCSSVDLVPTMLAAAGAKIPDNLPGLNLLDNIENDKPITREAIFGEGFAHDIGSMLPPAVIFAF